jgi:hypothetical protein
MSAAPSYSSLLKRFPARLRGHEAGHHDRQDDGATEVDEEDEERVSLDRQVHDERQPEDEDAGRKEREKPYQELPVGPDAQEIPVLPADGEEETGEYRQGAERCVEEAHGTRTPPKPSWPRS